MHYLDLAIVVGYLIAIVVVGVRLARRVDDARDFFLAGRSLTWWVIGLSIIGTNVSANGYVGASGGAYNLGIAQANFEWIGAIPAMILAETALSFLGLGLLPPAISWGALLFEAQNIRSIVAGPWLFAPGFLVLIAVLAFNFLGDGLRDAADPYATLGE